MELTIRKIVNSPVESNCYVLYQPGKNACIIVDPGALRCVELFSFLKEQKLIPEFVILTHEHFDHVWGVNKIKELYQSTIICSKACSDKIINKKKNMSVFYDQIGFETYPSDVIIGETGKMLLCDFHCQIMLTPGHTDGSICIMVDDKLFTGDTMIKDRKTVIKFPTGSKEKLYRSLINISGECYGKEIEVYPGHGESFSLREMSVMDYFPF